MSLNLAIALYHSSERLVRDFGSIVEPTIAFVKTYYSNCPQAG